MFIWSALSHMVPPLGEMGIRILPNEEVVVEAMRGAICEPGLYLFPGFDMSRKQSKAEKEAWAAKYRRGPVGLLVYHPQGQQPLAPGQLLTQLITDVIAGTIAAFLLTQVVASFGLRVLLVALLGLFSWVEVSLPYWNWYGFPAAFTAAEGIDQVVGWSLAGLVLAAIVKPTRSS